MSIFVILRMTSDKEYYVIARFSGYLLSATFTVVFIGLKYSIVTPQF